LRRSLPGFAEGALAAINNESRNERASTPTY
jgi:hypothetical protein